MKKMYKPANGKIVKKISIKDKKISAGFTAYNTVDCGFWKKIGRLFFIKAITNSRYEHLVVVTKCEPSFDNEIWVSRFEPTKKISIQRGVHYVVEATQKYGVNITPFLDRMLRPSLDEDVWSGDVIYFRWKKEFVKKEHFQELTQFIKDANASKKQYNLIDAVISSFPNKVQDFFVRILNLSQKNTQVFCSSFASDICNISMNLGMSKEDVLRLSPQEAIDLFFQQGYIESGIELLEYKDGKISAYNSDFFDIEFE